MITVTNQNKNQMVGPHRHEQSRSTLQTERPFMKNTLHQTSAYDHEECPSQLGGELSKLTRQEQMSPLQTSVRTKAAKHRPDQADQPARGNHPDLSHHHGSPGQRQHAGRLNLSLDHSALRLLQASSDSLHGLHQSQIFKLHGPATASASVDGPITEANAASSQQSTAAYPFMPSHAVRRAAPRHVLSHAASKFAAVDGVGKLALAA